MIGFERTLYLTNETAGEVIVNVVVLEGQVTGNIVVRTTTRNGNAEGKQYQLVFLCFVLVFVFCFFVMFLFAFWLVQYTITN